MQWLEIEGLKISIQYWCLYWIFLTLNKIEKPRDTVLKTKLTLTTEGIDFKYSTKVGNPRFLKGNLLPSLCSNSYKTLFAVRTLALETKRLRRIISNSFVSSIAQVKSHLKNKFSLNPNLILKNKLQWKVTV